MCGCEVVVKVPAGDCGVEDAGLEGVELVGVEVSDGSGKAGRKMIGEMEDMVIGELVSKIRFVEFFELFGSCSGGTISKESSSRATMAKDFRMMEAARRRGGSAYKGARR